MSNCDIWNHRVSPLDVLAVSYPQPQNTFGRSPTTGLVLYRRAQKRMTATLRWINIHWMMMMNHKMFSIIMCYYDHILWFYIILVVVISNIISIIIATIPNIIITYCMYTHIVYIWYVTYVYINTWYIYIHTYIHIYLVYMCCIYIYTLCKI